MKPQPSITCPRCGRTSFHPEDVKQKYCGYCHWWTSDPLLGEVVPDSQSGLPQADPDVQSSSVQGRPDPTPMRGEKT